MKTEKASLYQLDYEEAQMVSLLRSNLHIICTHMQDTTPCGEARDKAYATIEKIRKLSKKLENELLECAKAAASTGEGK